MKTNSLENMCIVTVDDETVLLTIIKSILSSHGASVYGAATVNKGIQLIREKEPDLIILDRHLREEDGFSLMEQLKKTPRLKDIPVLMLTGENRKGEIDKALNKGATWYVVKPFQPKILVDRALCAINRQKEDSQGHVFYIDA